MLARRTPLRWLLALPLLAAAACGDQLPPQPAPAAPVAVQEVTCVGDTRTGALRCSGGDAAGDAGGVAGDLIVGGQGTYAKMTSFLPSYSGGSFRFYATVQNLLGQAIGTTDGSSAAPTGVRVFFSQMPKATAGTGEITVVADGTGTFTAVGQPYYQYSQMIAPNATSGAKQWRLDMPNTVTTFDFTVLVSAPVRYPDGWVDLGAGPRSVFVGATTPVTATVRDRLGRPQPGAVTFNSAAPGIASVDPSTGVVTGVAPGTTTITGTSGTLSGTLVVNVQAPVASITATPQVINMIVGATEQITVTTRDANGNTVFRPVTYGSAAPGTASVSASGVVTGVALGSTVVTVTSESVSAQVTVNVVGAGPANLTGVVAGAYHACGLSPSGAAYCWGYGAAGQLGNGTTDLRRTPFPVSGGLTFTKLAAGGYRTCGLTAAGAAYCWGRARTSRFDFGITPTSTVPVEIGGGLAFTSIDMSSSHVCALTAAGAAYCWGLNDRNQLGIPSTTASSATPVAVSGGRTFTSITAGDEHTCALAAGGAAYCWGMGALGATPGVVNGTPVAVSGGYAFTQIDAGANDVCAVTALGAAYCWGDGNQGQLGDGLGQDSYDAPVAVSGGIAFATVSTGNAITCGVSTGGTFYCWGPGGYRFGRGTAGGASAVPVAIPQGLPFATLDVDGLEGGCGVTAAGRAYCWGENVYGSTGDGTRNTPRAVTAVAQYPGGL